MRPTRGHRPSRYLLQSARLELRPLTDDDFASWSEVRRRNEEKQEIPLQQTVDTVKQLLAGSSN